ncbi:MAG: DUF5666 domain-containing protein [Pseudomonadota bacterium]
MKRLDRRDALALMGATAVSACASPALVTRDVPNDPFEGGIGGTGIVGTLTDFGSLRVNGLRVELVNSTRFVSAFGPTSVEALAPGMSLTIFATQYKDRLLAHRVSADYALIGKAVKGPQGRVTVNGVPVLPEQGAIGHLTVGQRVAISGAWSAQGQVASRIDPAAASHDLIAGDVTIGAQGEVRVSGIPVHGAGTQPRAGEYAVATGQFLEGRFEADRFTRGRFSASAALRQLSVEGFLEPAPNAPGFRVSGLGHSFAPDTRLQSLARRRAIYFGPYTGLFKAKAGYVMPENLAARRRLLRPGFGEGFDGDVIATG